jgi:hypothetical protein
MSLFFFDAGDAVRHKNLFSFDRDVAFITTILIPILTLI